MGGGGKIAGDASVILRENPAARIVGVELSHQDAFYRSIQTRRFVRSAPGHTHQSVNADGIDVEDKGKIPTSQAIALGVEATRVTDEEIGEALVYALSSPWYGGRAKMIEGAPAGVLAAILNGAVKGLKGQTVVLSITGKNVDEETIGRNFAERGWVAEYPEFYDFICQVRKSMRAKMKPDEALGIIDKGLNPMLAHPGLLAQLMADFSGRDKEKVSREQMVARLMRKAKNVASLGVEEYLRRHPKEGKEPVADSHFQSLYGDVEGRVFHLWQKRDGVLTLRLVSGPEEGLELIFDKPQARETLSQFPGFHLIRRDGSPLTLTMASGELTAGAPPIGHKPMKNKGYFARNFPGFQPMKRTHGRSHSQPGRLRLGGPRTPSR
ncbi:MAG: hypothetical protein Q7T11_06070 [Deltaproteobacteria bacterium]|nr:hypothetical protein [Deltaproteobacteria bacterium]